MSVTHISQGIISSDLPGIIKYFDTSNAQIEFSRDPDGTEFYLKPNAWFACTEQNVKQINQVSIRLISPLYHCRVKSIQIQAKVGAPEIDGTTFVYAEYEYYRAGVWRLAEGSILESSTIEFSFMQ